MGWELEVTMRASCLASGFKFFHFLWEIGVYMVVSQDKPKILWSLLWGPPKRVHLILGNPHMALYQTV